MIKHHLATGLLFLAGAAALSFSLPRSKSYGFYSVLNADSAGPVAGLAKDHKGKSVVSSSGVVSLSTGLDNDFYYADSSGRTGYIYLETKLGKFLNENAAKVPLNISIVIDHSGSMAGEKMEQAKRAAREIISKLTPDDFVNIVIYDSQVDLLLPSTRVTSKPSILAKIDKITSGSATNLWGGTERGYEELRLNYKKNFINRVLLISDGLANVGVTSNYEIRKKVEHYKNQEGITLSSFGVGLDYNELLMTDMAEAGSGNYYFIDDPAKMAGLFEKELNGMLNVAAQNAELKLQFPAGVSLEKVFAFRYEQAGDELVFKFRDLFSEDTKGILVRFSIKDGIRDPLKFITRLSYDDVSDRKQKQLVNENLLTPCEEPEIYLVYFNKPVVEQTILFTANENMEKAMLEADKGDFEKARKISTENQAFLKANSLYVNQSGELRTMDSSNQRYFEQLQRAESLSSDSIKYYQKSNRARAYELRNKKN
jgi:Ca-activated chloride channel family protein